MKIHRSQLRATLTRSLAVLAVAFIPGPGLTQPAPIGTLTCTSMPSKARATADAVLSCSFKGTSGLQFQYSGTLLRRGSAIATAGKRVYIWSVLAQREISSGAALVGRYVGQTGGRSAGLHSQKRDTPVILNPARTSQLGENSSISVLELNLKAVRA